MDPLDDNMEMDTSTNSDPLDVADDVASTDVDAKADSSDAQAQPDDTLSIVRDVVEESKAAEGTASPADSGEEVDKTDDPATQKPQDETYSDVPFNKHPRFQQLLRERDSYKKDAGLYQNVQNFMDNNGISAEEAANGFVIMAQLKTDPHKAWESLKPIVQNLLHVIGEVLPEDLQARVQRGEMSAEAAQEISRARAEANTVKQSQTFKEQQQERRQQTQHAESLYNAAADWEADRRLKDPNFAAKFDALQKELIFIHHREGRADTPEGVVDQLKRAYASVSLPVATPSAPPVRKPVNSRLPSSGQAPLNTQPKPQSTLDIIKAARAKRTG